MFMLLEAVNLTYSMFRDKLDCSWKLTWKNWKISIFLAFCTTYYLFTNSISSSFKTNSIVNFYCFYFWYLFIVFIMYYCKLVGAIIANCCNVQNEQFYLCDIYNNPSTVTYERLVANIIWYERSKDKNYDFCILNITISKILTINFLFIL